MYYKQYYISNDSSNKVPKYELPFITFISKQDYLYVQCNLKVHFVTLVS